PVLVARTGAAALAPDAATALRTAGIPSYVTPARAVRAAAAMHRAASRTPDPGSHHVPAVPRHGTGAGRTPVGSGRGAVPAPRPGAGEAEVKALLRAAGLPVPRSRMADTAEDAVAAVGEVGGLAVVKAVVPGLLHKTEAGGVLLDVTPENARAAYE